MKNLKSAILTAYAELLHAQQQADYFRPLVNAIQGEVLRQIAAKDIDGNDLRDPSLDYLIAPEYEDSYYSTLAQKYRQTLGLHLEPGTCPLLMWENKALQAQHALNYACEAYNLAKSPGTRKHIQGITDSARLNLDNYAKLTALNIQLAKLILIKKA